MYDTEALAWQVVPADERRDYEVFAYRVWPVKFDKDSGHPCDPTKDDADLSAELELSAWKCIGYGVVGRGTGSFRECSPLWCNGCTEDHAVNEYWLIDDLIHATEAGKEFGHPTSHVEPATSSGKSPAEVPTLVTG